MQPAPKWTSHSAIAGAGAGLVSSIVTCPLDVVKTKLQAQRAARGTTQYLGILGGCIQISCRLARASDIGRCSRGSGTVKDILARDGVRGMYRGLGPVILGYLPTWAIYFALYDGIKSQLGENIPTDTRLDGMWNQNTQVIQA